MTDNEDVVRKTVRLEFTGQDGQKMEGKLPLVFRIERPTLSQNPPKGGLKVKSEIEKPTLTEIPKRNGGTP